MVIQASMGSQQCWHYPVPEVPACSHWYQSRYYVFSATQCLPGALVCSRPGDRDMLWSRGKVRVEVVEILSILHLHGANSPSRRGWLTVFSLHLSHQPWETGAPEYLADHRASRGMLIPKDFAGVVFSLIGKSLPPAPKFLTHLEWPALECCQCCISS